jgi:hypothetical protein
MLKNKAIVSNIFFTNSFLNIFIISILIDFPPFGNLPPYRHLVGGGGIK